MKGGERQGRRINAEIVLVRCKFTELFNEQQSALKSTVQAHCTYFRIPCSKYGEWSINLGGYNKDGEYF